MSEQIGELVWRKATKSSAEGSDCVEVAVLPQGGAAVRDSKLGDDSPVLEFNEGEWRAFLAGVRAGEFD
jgi:hypothetical protein